MSFTYWGWANQYQGKKYKAQSLAFHDKAIALTLCIKQADKGQKP
jgi:hypothetical protein